MQSRAPKPHQRPPQAVVCLLSCMGAERHRTTSGPQRGHSCCSGHIATAHYSSAGDGGGFGRPFVVVVKCGPAGGFYHRLIMTTDKPIGPLRRNRTSGHRGRKTRVRASPGTHLARSLGRMRVEVELNVATIQREANVIRGIVGKHLLLA